MQRIITIKNALVGRRSLLALVVLLCLSVLSASAQTVTQNHIKYTITNSTHTAAVNGTDDKYIQNVVIADSVAYNGRNYPVVTINSKAFQDYTNIRSVSFGSNLKKIGTYAFSGCQFLSEIIVPEGVESIENYAFQNCALRYADLPSTLRTLGSGVFKTNAPQQLDTLVLRTAYYNEAGQMNILSFNTSCFNSKTNLKNCVLMVPKKAYDYYAASTSSSGTTNWGYFFANITAFGTAPSGCTVAPKGELKDFRDLSKVDVTFNFDDETLTDALSFGPADHIEATLVLPDGQRLSAGSVVLKGNTISIDFAEVLQQNRTLFISSSEADTAIDVQLELDGQIQLEECPYMLASFFAHHAISWNVPLLPSVYDLPQAPVVEPRGEAQDGLYDYKAFEAVTLTFDGYTALSLDSSTGAYLQARLLKDDGTLLDVATSAVVIGENAMTIPFCIPVDELRVRRTSGIESYGFKLEVEGQVCMKDGNDEKNFRFTLPFDATSAPTPWRVAAVYIPEPTGVSILPADKKVELKRLTDVAVTFEGVQSVAISTASDAIALRGSLYMDGFKIANVTAAKVNVEGNTLHLLFDAVDERLITLITTNSNYSYNFTMSLAADLLTDGYPCRVIIGNETIGDGTDGDIPSVGTHYTLQWAAPVWSVPAIIYDIPEVTVSVPAATDGEVTDYQQLKVVELNVENYSKVEVAPAGAATTAFAPAVGRLMRSGNPVCVTNNITAVDNKIVLDFSNKLNYNAVGITPDDDPEQLVDLSLYFEGDLRFDGLSYHLVYDGEREGQKWSLTPIVVYKLPAPSIEHEGSRIYFTCGAENVEFHYTITNEDARPVTTEQAVKGKGGSSLRIPLKRRYVISVYVTREGYEDSDIISVPLELEGEPEVMFFQ